MNKSSDQGSLGLSTLKFPASCCNSINWSESCPVYIGRLGLGNILISFLFTLEYFKLTILDELFNGKLVNLYNVGLLFQNC